ncbi:amino acid adenylation domain-containing protein [Tropicimonas aquimaris]|uniref:Amino acid adenylation domain-containing protein n=1 Tax=Tropicimonas aquimaris TaxID=914152 RepID=A0ABW3IXZ5_9RHOB
MAINSTLRPRLQSSWPSGSKMIRPTFPALLHTQLELVADANPDKPAFRLDGASLTYADLAAATSRMARTLVEAGVCRGDRVALFLDRSFEASIALFGILRAGAAYVPIDPGASQQRVHEILDLSDARCLVTTEAKRAALPGGFPASMSAVIGLSKPLEAEVDVISWEEALSSPDLGARAQALSETDLAYIMFTSGSTGTPKGIMHTHASGMSYACMAANLYGLHAEDRFSNACGLHFDMSTLDYFCSTLVGASTTIIPDPWLKLPASLAELIEAERLTVWYSVPLALLQLVEFGDLGSRDLSALRIVLYGGEVFVPKHLETLRRLLPDALIGNVYGPAETNQCTWFNVPEGWNADRGPVPIGAACPNADLLVIGEDDADVAPGETGELAVRAPTMMQGYWRQPELNRTAFLERAGAGGETQRYYRTGDIVIERPDGNLDFLGRRDRMVKSRGFRVELDEVERAIAGLPMVSEAATFTVALREGVTVIRGAAILNPEETIGARDLAAAVARLLPHYARPDRIELVPEFPRTGSGKIDRRALAEQLSGEAQVSGVVGHA